MGRERELAELDQWLHEVWRLCSRCQEGLRRIEEEHKHIDQLLKTLDNFAALNIDLGLLASSKRFLDVHIGKLRRKLGDASPIVTVWGVGYKVGPTPGDRPSS